ncbi:hypothetical protein DAI22_02g164250 [Oryza sativa Japonica Group]|nr:hypothetical protein DAI22_02g164250 [Oryza sativa Japonica Group]
MYENREKELRWGPRNKTNRYPQPPVTFSVPPAADAIPSLDSIAALSKKKKRKRLHRRRCLHRLIRSSRPPHQAGLRGLNAQQPRPAEEQLPIPERLSIQLSSDPDPKSFHQSRHRFRPTPT